MRSVKGLAGPTDPIVAEIEASRIIDLLGPDRNGRLEDRMMLAEALLEGLPSKRTADALALSIALSTILDEPWAAMARDGADRLRAAGVQDPAWANSIGTATFEAAWGWTDELGDQDMIVASFRHDGHPPHGFSLMADHNFHGLFRQAGAARDPEVLRDAWFKTSGVPLRPMTALDLAGRWAAGTEWFRMYLDPPVYEGVAELMPLLEARARLLPTPQPKPEPEPMSEEERDAWFVRFAGASAGRAAAIDPDPEGMDRFIVEWLLDYRENHGEGDVLRWSPIVCEIGLMDWLPRKATLDDGAIDRLPSVLRALVRFAATERGLADEHRDETLEAVDQFESPFREAMADVDAGGPAKRIAAAMARAGVDVMDPEAVARWIDDFNGRPLAERDEVLGNGS